MRALISYNPGFTFLGELEIENIGDFAIEASNDEQLYWYFVVRTTAGISTIATSGPTIPDIMMLPKSFKQTRYEMMYKEPKLIKEVTNFLNDKDKKITHANIIDIDEAISRFINLRDYLEDYEEE